MTPSEFEQIVHRHSLEPNNLLYASNGLCGEAGEAANQIKKIHMARVKPEWITQNENALPNPEEFREAACDELGDTLFYLVSEAKQLGTTLEELMQRQADKLGNQSIKYGRTFLK